MLLSLAKRLLLEPDPRALLHFVRNFAWKGMGAVRAFNRRRDRGDLFPAFTFLSVTNRCNLRCRGCWVAGTREGRDMEPSVFHRVIAACKQRGSFFFGILGGEPLLYPDLLDILGRHPDCYFLLFTNGTLVNGGFAERLRRLGNVSPLISVEGLEKESDDRRGGNGVYGRTLEGLDHCRRHRLITGVATSVCRTNMKVLVSHRFVQSLIERRVHYLWYYIYRPVGPDPAPELALGEEDVLRLRRFMVDLRTRAPIIVVDAYWDHEGKALCPAATGISHHISPAGDVEPCPPIQFAGDNVAGEAGVAETIERSTFLGRFRSAACEATRGCILMERPDLLERLVRDQGAYDSSGRGTALAELSRMACRVCHHLPGKEIPEKSWAYRFAKKRWFFGFGAYG